MDHDIDVEPGQTLELVHTSDPAHKRLVGKRGRVTRIQTGGNIIASFPNGQVVLTDEDDWEVVA